MALKLKLRRLPFIANTIDHYCLGTCNILRPWRVRVELAPPPAPLQLDEIPRCTPHLHKTFASWNVIEPWNPGIQPGVSTGARATADEMRLFCRVANLSALGIIED